jgi:hypothetical protein
MRTATDEVDRLEAKATAAAEEAGRHRTRRPLRARRRPVRVGVVLRGHQHAAADALGRSGDPRPGCMLFVATLTWVATFPVSLAT